MAPSAAFHLPPSLPASVAIYSLLYGWSPFSSSLCGHAYHTTTTLQPEKIIYMDFVFGFNVLKNYTLQLHKSVFLELISRKLHYLHLLVIQRSTSKNRWELFLGKSHCLGIVFLENLVSVTQNNFGINFAKTSDWSATQTHSQSMDVPLLFLLACHGRHPMCPTYNTRNLQSLYGCSSSLFLVFVVSGSCAQSSNTPHSRNITYSFQFFRWVRIRITLQLHHTMSADLIRVL